MHLSEPWRNELVDSPELLNCMLIKPRSVVGKLCWQLYYATEAVLMLIDETNIRNTVRAQAIEQMVVWYYG
jgi:hypothetical protein